MKNKCIVKKYSFKKCYLKILCHCISTYEVRHTLDLSPLKKLLVFSQNTSVSPNFILFNSVLGSATNLQ